MLRDLNPRSRVRIAFAGGALLVAVAMFAACGACGRRSPGGGDTTATANTSTTSAASSVQAKHLAVDASALRDALLWGNAKDGDTEDLMTLAAHEGAMGLVEAADDAALRPTAIRAMAYARGWAQLPLLTKAAAGKSDEEARLALESTIELAARPRRAEDPEDAQELREGCDALVALARDGARTKERRVGALRAVRMMPCPPRKPEDDLPSELDAK